MYSLIRHLLTTFSRCDLSEDHIPKCCPLPKYSPLLNVEHSCKDLTHSCRLGHSSQQWSRVATMAELQSNLQAILCSAMLTEIIIQPLWVANCRSLLNANSSEIVWTAIWLSQTHIARYVKRLEAERDSLHHCRESSSIF